MIGILFRTVLFAVSMILLILSLSLSSSRIYHSSGRDSLNEKEIGGRKEEYPLFADLSTLEEVYSIVLKPLIPNKGTDGYIQPEAKVIADFKCIVLDMMMIDNDNDNRRQKKKKNDDDDDEEEEEEEEAKDDDGDDNKNDACRSHPRVSCGRIDLRSLTGMYRIGTFVDRDNGRSYCILATTSIEYPWGNVVVDLDWITSKKLSFDCPHPMYDAETGEQGIRMLKGTTARSWIVSGSHRMANNRTVGTCQPQYSHYASDVAHSTNNCFHSAVAAIKFYYESVVHEDYTSIQLHGMGKTTCGSIDTFFSHGSCSVLPSSSSNRSSSSSSSTNKIDILQKIAQTYDTSDTGRHVVATNSSGDCELCGSTNTQGRLINGVALEDVCDTFASTYNGRFIQIEQKRDYRREGYAQFWNNVFNEAYPQISLLTDTYCMGNGGSL